MPIYVVYSGGLHSTLVLERKDIPPALKPLVAKAGACGEKFIEIGWGEDDGFRKPLSLAIICKSLMGSHRTVMRVEGCSTSPGDCLSAPDASLVRVILTRAGFQRLCAFIAATHRKDEKGRPVHLGGGWFQAHGKYSAFHTCNNWTADAPREAGCPIRPGVCQFPGPLMVQVKRFGTVLRSPR